MAPDFQEDVEGVGRIEAVPTILEVLHNVTGMGFVTLARVTADRWVACAVLDEIGLGLEAGSELRIEMTICNEIRQSRQPVIIENVAEDKVWCKHAIPAFYGFQSYISVPVILADGSFFGTLCALDPRPARLNAPEIVGMFRLFAELIAKHLDAYKKLAATESALLNEFALVKRREEELRRSEARYRDVVETQAEMICRSLPDTTLTFVNNAYCRYFAKQPEELIGKKFLDLLPDAEQLAVRQLINATLEGWHSGPSDQQNLQPDGSTRWVQWINHVLRDENGEVEIQSVGRDITEQKRAQQELEKKQEELRLSQTQIRKLAGCLMNAQEAERRRIARELHDDLNQRLAAICISLGNLKLRFPPPDALGDQLAEVQQRAKEITNDIRNLSHELRPVLLEQAGLGAALQSLIAEFNASSRIRFGLRLPEPLVPLSDELAICIFRIAQESLRNITTHSRASQAGIELSVQDGFIKLLIDDDGCGFDIDKVQRRGGLRLIGMAERVRQLQGVFELRTKPGRGTSLLVMVPMN